MSHWDFVLSEVWLVVGPVLQWLLLLGGFRISCICLSATLRLVLVFLFGRACYTGNAKARKVLCMSAAVFCLSISMLFLGILDAKRCRVW